MSVNAKHWGNWTEAPDPIAEDLISKRYEADVVIVGAGISGVTCALRAAQGGKSVIVLEKWQKWSARGGNIGVANSSFMRAQGIENDVDALCKEWQKRCGNRSDQRIARMYLTQSERAMDWLLDIVTRDEYGVQPSLQGSLYRGDTYDEHFGSHRFFGGAMEKKGMRAGAADCVYAMYNESLKLGVQYLFNTPAEQLSKTDGRVTGVIAKDEEGDYVKVDARSGVVLATGDIGGNEEMCEDLAPFANRCAKRVYAPHGVNTGDGHRMALWAGAAFEDTPFPTMIHPQAYCFINYCFLFVKPDGMRFMNEDNYVQGKCVTLIHEQIPYAWSIIDSAWDTKIPQTLEYGGGLFWGTDYKYESEEIFDVKRDQRLIDMGLNAGNAVMADTIEELAEKMGVPVDTFVEQFERYSELVAKGHDDDYGKNPDLLIPLDTPPYIALKFAPALLAVCGGVKVNEKLQALTEDLKPIEGLYAIGNAMGGRYGVDYPLLIPGNSHGTALTFGFLLGEQFSEE